MPTPRPVRFPRLPRPPKLHPSGITFEVASHGDAEGATEPTVRPIAALPRPGKKHAFKFRQAVTSKP